MCSNPPCPLMQNTDANIMMPAPADAALNLDDKG